MGILAKLLVHAGAAAVVTGLGLAAASADMGTAPVGPGGVYGGFTVGYTRSDGPDTEVFNQGGTPKYLDMDPEGGLEGGVHFGYVFAPSFASLSNLRLEGSLYANSSQDDDFAANPGLITLVVPNGGSTIGNNVTPIVGRQESSEWGAALTLKGDLVIHDGFSTAIGLEFFAAHGNTSFDARGVGSGSFLVSNIDSEYYGFLALAEPELRLTETVSLVGRLAGGFYAYDFDARFTGSGFPSFGDREDGVGLRAEGLAGLRLYLSQNLSLTVFGGVDYWSETPVANFPETVGPATFIDREGALKLKAGITATIALGMR